MHTLSSAPPTRGREIPQKRWVEPVAALPMALATLFTAWCSYQSGAWTRQSNRLMNEYNSLERRAGLLSMQGMQTATIHIAMFMQALAAREAGNETLANFYVARFPSNVRRAYEAWLAQKPFENPKADPHPFVPNLYELPGTREAAEATANAAGKVQDSRAACNEACRDSLVANPMLGLGIAFSNKPRSNLTRRILRTASSMRDSGTLFSLTS